MKQAFMFAFKLQDIENNIIGTVAKFEASSISK